MFSVAALAVKKKRVADYPLPDEAALGR